MLKMSFKSVGDNKVLRSYSLLKLNRPLAEEILYSNLKYENDYVKMNT